MFVVITEVTYPPGSDPRRVLIEERQFKAHHTALSHAMKFLPELIYPGAPVRAEVTPAGVKLYRGESPYPFREIAVTDVTHPERT